MNIEAIKEEKTGNKKLLKGLTLQELKNYFIDSGESKFRGEQVFNWMYNHLSNNFNEMLNLPKSLRRKLEEVAELNTLQYVDSEISGDTGTKKFIFSTQENHKIESVIIPENNRTTLCISTQIGCPLDCAFCATGLMG
ncbi:MAG: 23S rRNA (adenine(2503)-C(2))-methyltransferase RlmN, partial [Ignavibacteriaceae bacterium]